jgi:hypothetical protein
MKRLIVLAARSALDSANVNLVLVWVKEAGLKPAGQVEPPIAAADRTIATGKLQEAARLVSARMEEGLHRTYEAVMAKKGCDAKDVAAGREFTSAYIEYTHYVERLYHAAETLAPAHSH